MSELMFRDVVNYMRNANISKIDYKKQSIIEREFNLLRKFRYNDIEAARNILNKMDLSMLKEVLLKSGAPTRIGCIVSFKNAKKKHYINDLGNSLIAIDYLIKNKNKYKI